MRLKPAWWNPFPRPGKFGRRRWNCLASLYVALEVPHFTIRDLLSLSVNSLVDTRRREGAHVPVLVNGVMVGWAEFDVIDGRLAVRMTEMV